MTIKKALERLIMQRGGTPPQGGDLSDALDCLCECDGGGGVTHWDDLEGKPFYEETERIVIVEHDKGFAGPCEGAVDGYGGNMGVLKSSAIVIGDTYIATIDGVDYTGVAEYYADSSSEDGNGVRINFYADGSDTFMFNLDSYDGYMYYVDIDELISDSWGITITHVKSELKTLDPKFLPEHEHEVSWNDLTDRPFYKELTALTLLENAEIVTDYNTGNNSSGSATSSFSHTNGPEIAATSFVLGQTYRVVYDGKEYFVKGVDDGYSNIALGNYSYWELTEEIPFSLSIQKTGEVGRLAGYVIGEVGSTHSITIIEEYNEDLKTLDPEYLPKAEAIADVTEAPTAEQFNALLASLRAAGYLAQ